MLEEALYEPMRAWLEQYLRDKYKRAEIITVDSHSERLDRVLAKSYNEFLSIYEDNSKLRESDEIFKVSRQLEIINDELLTLRNYYNANITNYNKMIKKFPTNIVASIKKYKEKPFYDLKDMTDEDYEDFKL